MNVALVSLVLVGFLLIELLIGGTRLLFSIPTYSILAIAAVLSAFRWKRSQTPANPWCLLSVAIFFGYVVARALRSPVPYLSWPDLFLALGALIVYFLFALHLTKPNYRCAMLGLMFALALANVAIGLLQFSKGSNFMPFGFLQRADYGSRASGFYICPNHLAGFLHVTTLFGLSIVCWSRWRATGKLLVAYVTLVCMVGMLLTGSRGGYLSMAGSLVVFAILSLLAAKRASAGRFALVAVGALVCFSLLAGGVKMFIDRSELVRTRAGSVVDPTNMRIFLWQAALEQFQLSPVTGTGSGTYLFYGRKFRSQKVDNDPIRAHNDYLELLAEYGIIGAAGFLVLLAAHLISGWRTFRWTVQQRLRTEGRIQSNTLALNIGAISAVSAYAAHSIVDFNLHIPANALMMAFVFAILANSGPRNGSLPSRPTVWTNGLFKIALPAIGIAFLAIGPRKIPAEIHAENARTAMRDGDYARSIQFAQEAILSEPMNPNPYYYLGWCRFALANDPAMHPLGRKVMLKKSARAFKDGLEVFPQDTRLLIDFAEVSRINGDWSSAQNAYEKAIEWDPNSPWSHLKYGIALQSEGLLDRARTQFEESLKLRRNPTAKKKLKEIEKQSRLDSSNSTPSSSRNRHPDS
jgi:O-antigen ligase